jgi:hypothetical protein
MHRMLPLLFISITLPFIGGNSTAVLCSAKMVQKEMPCRGEPAGHFDFLIPSVWIELW